MNIIGLVPGGGVLFCMCIGHLLLEWLLVVVTFKEGC